MPKITKTQAARELGIARATLYKLIAQGKVSPTPDGLIDQAELIRVAPYIDTLHERTRTPIDIHERLQTSTDIPSITRKEQGSPISGRLSEGVHEQPHIDTYGRLQTSTDTLVDILREQLRLMQAREHEQARLYEERERAYREHIAQLTTMLHQAHQQNQRLLDMPRNAPGPAPPGSGAPVAPDVPRGDMRRRIVALLREHPDGLSPALTRQILGSEKDLGATMKAMVRDGLIRRVETGWYVANEPSRHDHT
jgi:hypothetical protein